MRIPDGIEEIGKDLLPLGGIFGVFFAKFDNLVLKLLQVTDFNLSLSQAIELWESLIRSGIGILTIIVLIWRIKTLKKKYDE